MGAKARANVVADVVSTVLPAARVIGAVRRLATGTTAFVGKAGVEIELLDATTGERVLAGVDERMGVKTVRGVTNTWADVESAFDLWARLLKIRLGYLRAMDAG